MSSLSRILNKEQVQLTESHRLLPSMKQEEDYDITFTVGDHQLEWVLDSEDDGQNLGQLSWDFMDCDGFLSAAQEGDGRSFYQELYYHHHRCPQYLSVKQEEEEDDDDDDERKLMSLNLRLNYQEILDAWSDRTPWAHDDTSFLSANIHNITGEVPKKLMEEEERRRREASVMRYREKRQTRLFSKKIRYQVRKLNAEKRPRLKGRFVKRAPPAEKMIYTQK